MDPVMDSGRGQTLSLQEQLIEAQNEIKSLKEMLFKIQNKNVQSEIPKSDGIMRKNYFDVLDTSEEEEIVAQETAWLLTKTKKRKLSPEGKTIEKPKPKRKVAFQTTNEQNLNTPGPSNYQAKEAVQTPSKRKNLNPPPVIISKMTDYSELKNSLQTAKLQFKTSLMNNNQLKINAESDADYRGLTKYLNDKKLEWHTYENKHTRPIRVMVRDLHPTCDPEEIKSELQDNGFKILDVVNKIKKTREGGREIRTALPLFQLSFENSEDIKKIYDIKYLSHMRVKIEAIRKNNKIPQCKRCQRYGHTQKFCQREVKCVKCAANHLSADCTKPKDTAAKCSNCAEDHPANYRGCLVAKELQRRRDKLTKPLPLQKSQATESFSYHIKNGISYAQAAKTDGSGQGPNLNPSDPQSMVQMLHNIMNAINKLSERLDKLEHGNTALLY